MPCADEIYKMCQEMLTKADDSKTMSTEEDKVYWTVKDWLQPEYVKTLFDSKEQAEKLCASHPSLVPVCLIDPKELKALKAKAEKLEELENAVKKSQVESEEFRKNSEVDPALLNVRTGRLK